MTTEYKDPRISDYGTWLTLLIWWPIVQLIEEYDPRFKKILVRDSVNHFPDGTACLSTTVDMTDAWNALSFYRERGIHIRQNTRFRSLKCFQERDYQLLTTGEYFDRIGGEADLIVTPPLSEVQEGEAHPERLSVQVQWWDGKPAADIQEEFRLNLNNWAESVKMAGIFGEGPAKFHSETLQFKRSRATFYIDVGKSGQNTLNWLTLSILNFGAKRAPMNWIYYAEPIK